jgi:hypothetical protein
MVRATKRVKQVLTKNRGIVKQLHGQFKHHTSAIRWIGKELKRFGIDVGKFVEKDLPKAALWVGKEIAKGVPKLIEEI